MYEKDSPFLKREGGVGWGWGGVGESSRRRGGRETVVGCKVNTYIN